MESATIPSIRIDPSFPNEFEQSLNKGDSLTSFVETAIRLEVTRRQAQSEFARRGLAFFSKTLAAGDSVPGALVIARLQSKLNATQRTNRTNPANEAARIPSDL